MNILLSKKQTVGGQGESLLSALLLFISMNDDSVVIGVWKLVCS